MVVKQKNPGDLDNPIEDTYNRELNPGGLHSDDNSPKETPKSDSASDLQEAEKKGDKRAISDSAAGKVAVEAASTAASAAASPIAGQAVKLLSKIKIPKKAGIGTLVIGVLLAGGLLIAGILGPGLLLMQVKNVMVDKFSDTLAAIDQRSEIIIAKKLVGDTTTSCTIKVKCRFNGFSDDMIKSMEDHGIKVNKEGTTKDGLTKVSSFETPDGAKITAKNFRDTMIKNPAARGVVKLAFSPKYTTYSDRLFGKLSSIVRVSKSQKVDGTTQEELDDSLKKAAAGELAGVDPKTGLIETVDKNGNVTYTDANGNPVSAAEAEQLKATASDLAAKVSELESTGESAVVDLSKTALANSIASGLDTGGLVCQGYGIIRAVGYGAKLIGSLQLIRYAYAFMNTADTAQASYLSNVKPEVVSYMASKLTATDKQGKSATDSFGYKYAAYGQTALPKDKQLRADILQFSAGSGIGATIENITSLFNQWLGGAPNVICKGLQNPWVQGGLLLGGTILTIISFGSTGSIGISASSLVLPVLLVLAAIAAPTIANYIAGTLVTSHTNSQAAGNAITSGMGALNARNSQMHALSILTKKEAVAYARKTKQILALDNAAAAKVTSPFDLTNTASLSFSVASTINNTVRSVFSKNALLAPQQTISNAIGALSAPASALAADPTAEYSQCTDNDYIALDLAADPFCNLRFGLNQSSLTQDPLELSNFMYNNGYVDANGEAIPGTEYETFLNECVNRTEPWGDTGADFQGNDGFSCSQSSKTYGSHYDEFRVFYLDRDVVQAMDGGEDTTPAAPSPNTTSAAGWQWPLAGKSAKDVSQGWGVPTFKGIHKGIDVGVPLKTPVYAAHAGVLSPMSFDSNTCGRMYIFSATGTNPQVWFAYQHLAIVGAPLPDGTVVKPGDQIGTVGPAGGSTCGTAGFYHLHFSIELTDHISTYSDPLNLSTDPLKGYLP